MSQVWSNFQHTVRAIAQEAVETAKELREAHNASCNRPRVSRTV